MEISFSQSFLDNLERIDNKVVIDKAVVDQGDFQNKLHFVCHGKKVQVCVEGISGECRRLDFYSGEDLDFTITGENIVMNPERTIFEFNLPAEPKAIIECPWITEDTKFLESIGTDLGSSLYKDIPISKDSLVWKETLGKYIVDRGLQDNHLYDTELLDTKSGILEERPIRFKSYRNIQIDQGNWEVDMIKTTKVVKHDVYTEISSSSFLVWDSPMIDAKVNLEVDPECIDKIGEYVDPGEVIYGNTDCFQFTNYQSSLVGFKITGTEGSKVEVLFNRKSSEGEFTSFSGTIGEDGTVEIRFSDLPYYHFNGIRSIGPSKVAGIETIMYLEEVVDEYNPNPDKTYVAKIHNVGCNLKIDGVCDYIEYEKYLGEIKEIGRGKDSIDSIPGIMIRPINRGGLDYEIMSQEKRIQINQNSRIGSEIYYTVFQVTIDNNIEVNGNILTTSLLYADYKIRIEQTGIIWKIYESPDYINGDDGYGIYLLEHEAGSQKGITIMTNSPSHQALRTVGVSEYFKVDAVSVGTEVIDGERWSILGYYIETLSDNTEDSWRPKKQGTNDPVLISFYEYYGSTPLLSLYAIQLKEIKNPIKVWEETIIPGKFTEVEDSKITLQNSMSANFIVAKTGGDGVNSLNWYYYDLSGTNQFYITDHSFKTTNVGLEYLVSPDTTILDLGTGEKRSTYGRLINVNRSDIIGSLGSLVVTESSAYPRSWRDLIDNNTANIEVVRELDNIYIQVGPDDHNLRNEDYEVELSSIGTFSVGISANFKYVIQSYGYLKIYPDYNFSDKPSSNLLSRIEVFNEYNYTKYYTFALVKLDEDKEMEGSYIEIRSGDVVRKITPKIVGPNCFHNYLFHWPEDEGGEIEKPNLIRIFNNGAVNDPNKKFYYTSTTTPKMETSGLEFSETSDSYFYNDDGGWYGYHKSSGSVSIPNSRALSYSKYPMKSFGYIREMSKDYSADEKFRSGVVSYLEYPFYMKGKEHFLWCVESLSGLSDITDPVTLNEKEIMMLDAHGDESKTLYVVSRYSNSNQTFVIESPTQAEYKIKRNELEVDIKILSQQNIGLNSRSQIEYAIPIQISSNVKNSGGNIFLGKIEFAAKTKITDDSVNDVIDVSNDIIETEGIDASYITTYILGNKTQNLDIMIFQQGTNPDVLDFYSEIPDLGIEESVNYVIPEIGSNFKITSLNCVLSRNAYGPQGNNDCELTSQIYDENYFLVEVTSHARIEEGEPHWYEYSPGDPDYPIGIIQDTEYILNINVGYNYKGTAQTNAFYKGFRKYGCNYGLLVDNYIGFGIVDNYNPDLTYNNAAYIELPSEGGFIRINAGIFYAVDGLSTTEALIVPLEYEFIGENKPLEFKWEDGNLDDGGNLYIKVPPRVRDDIGSKEYVLRVTQQHKYYPINLYVVFYQQSMYVSGHPDTEKDSYKLMFLKNSVNIYSNGSVEKGEDKLYFVHNLTESEFNKVTFDWVLRDSGTFPTSLDDINFLEEAERSYEEGYVKFNFKPNGGRRFIKAKIRAKYDGKVIGSIDANQGYFCLIFEYWNARTASIAWISNYTPYASPFSRVSPYRPLLYSYQQGHETHSTYSSSTPCKANNDNSDASYGYGRGVYRLRSYKQEYYDSEEVTCDINSLFNGSEIVYISPKQVLEFYDLSFVNSSSGSSSTTDPDARINPRFNEGSEYVTSTNFSGYITYPPGHSSETYAPYVELSYLVKEEFIRETIIITASGKVTLKHPDTKEMVNFYLMFVTTSYASDEPANPETFELSDYKLKFGYQGGTKQVSYHPESFDMNVSKLPATADWLSYSISEGSNIISVTVAENNTRTVDPTEEAAATRSMSRSVVPELIDDEGGGGGGIINPIDPDDNDNSHTLIDDGGGGGGSGGGSSSGGDSSGDSSGSSSGNSSDSGGSSSSSGSDSSGSSSDSSGSSSSSSTNEGEEETVYAFYRTAQIKIELIDDRNSLNYIMKTVYIDVEQDPDYTATGDGPQHVIMDSSIRVKSDDANPVVIRLPENSALDVNVTNDPLPVSIDGTPTVNLAAGTSVEIDGTPTVNLASGTNVGISGTPTVNLASGTNVGISGQPISVTGTVEASNIPTDYARSSDIPSDIASSSDVISAKNDIISAMPTCKYTPPSSGGDS